jgi:hypothetical protein
MRTKLLLLLVLVVLAVSVNAQGKNEKPFKIGAGVVLGLPVGDVSTGYSLAYGVDVQGEYAAASSIGLTLSAGYLDWAAKSGYGGNSGSIPILVGGKYYFQNKIYASAQVGVSIFTEKGSGNYFTFAPGIGYQISEKFDLLLKYQSITVTGSSINFLGVRAGLTF